MGTYLVISGFVELVLDIMLKFRRPSGAQWALLVGQNGCTLHDEIHIISDRPTVLHLHSESGPYGLCSMHALKAKHSKPNLCFWDWWCSVHQSMWLTNPTCLIHNVMPMHNITEIKTTKAICMCDIKCVKIGKFSASSPTMPVVYACMTKGTVILADLALAGGNFKVRCHSLTSNWESYGWKWNEGIWILGIWMRFLLFFRIKPWA